MAKLIELLQDDAPLREAKSVNTRGVKTAAQAKVALKKLEDNIEVVYLDLIDLLRSDFVKENREFHKLIGEIASQLVTTIERLDKLHVTQIK